MRPEEAPAHGILTEPRVNQTAVKLRVCCGRKEQKGLERRAKSISVVLCSGLSHHTGSILQRKILKSTEKTSPKLNFLMDSKRTCELRWAARSCGHSQPLDRDEPCLKSPQMSGARARNQEQRKRAGFGGIGITESQSHRALGWKGSQSSAPSNAKWPRLLRRTRAEDGKASLPSDQTSSAEVDSV